MDTPENVLRRALSVNSMLNPYLRDGHRKFTYCMPGSSCEETLLIDRMSIESIRSFGSEVFLRTKTGLQYVLVGHTIDQARSVVDYGTKEPPFILVEDDACNVPSDGGPKAFVYSRSELTSNPLFAMWFETEKEARDFMESMASLRRWKDASGVTRYTAYSVLRLP